MACERNSIQIKIMTESLMLRVDLGYCTRKCSRYPFSASPAAASSSHFLEGHSGLVVSGDL